jgi:hypothetical protein
MYEEYGCLTDFGDQLHESSIRDASKHWELLTSGFFLSQIFHWPRKSCNVGFEAGFSMNEHLCPLNNYIPYVILIIIPTRSDLEKDEKWRVWASFYHSKVLFEPSREICELFFKTHPLKHWKPFLSRKQRRLECVLKGPIRQPSLKRASNKEGRVKIDWKSRQ